MSIKHIFSLSREVINTYNIWLTLVALVAIQLFWYFVLGVRSGGDTRFYLNGASLLLEDGLYGFSDFRMYMKLTYMSFVAAHLFFSDNINSIIISQVILHIASCILLWSIMRKYCSAFSAFILICLFSFFPYLSRWNFYILTESIAISLSIIAVWIVYKVCITEKYRFLCFVPILIVIALVRPHTTFIVFGLLLFYVYFKQSVRNLSKFNLLSVAIVVGVIIYLVFCFNNGVVSGSLKKLNSLFSSGQVIAGAWYIDNIPRYKDSSFFVNIYTIAKLGVLRVLSEALMVRTYYSIANNLHLIFYFLMIYGLTICALFSKNNNYLKLGLTTMIASNFFLIALTFASWDGRFSMYVMPQFWVLMALGIGHLEHKNLKYA